MRCAKNECPNKPEHRVQVMPGVTITVCHTHLAWAMHVIETGRP